MAEPNWTTFPLHGTGTQYYCDASRPDDSGDGLSPATAKKTVAAGVGLIGDALPDQLLFKRGETWDNEGEVQFTNKGGVDETYPLLIGSYGTGARPKFTDTSLTLCRFGLVQPGPIALVDIDFERITPALSLGGIYWGGGGPSLRIENCKFKRWQTNCTINPNSQTLDLLTMIGNVIQEAYHATGNDAQGILVGGQAIGGGEVTLAVIQDNYFIHNGYYDGVPGAVSTERNHNAYFNAKCVSTQFTRNVSAQASATGAQFRRGGTVWDNAFLANPIGILWGHNESAYPSEAAVGICRDNVVTIGADIVGNGSAGTPDFQRGFGIMIEATQGGRVTNNLVAHLDVGQDPRGIQFEWEIDGTEVDNNVVYHWWNPQTGGINPKSLYNDDTNAAGFWTPNVHDNIFQPDGTDGYIVLAQGVMDTWTMDGNSYFSPGPQSGDYFYDQAPLASDAAYVAATGETNAIFTETIFTDPSRTLASYDTLIGGLGTLDDFLANCALQEKGAWNTNYEAVPFNNYMRFGFDMPNSAPPPSGKVSFAVVAGGSAFGVSAGS